MAKTSLPVKGEFVVSPTVAENPSKSSTQKMNQSIMEPVKEEQEMDESQCRSIQVRDRTSSNEISDMLSANQTVPLLDPIEAQGTYKAIENDEGTPIRLKGDS